MLACQRAADFGVSVLTLPRRAIWAVVIVLTWRSGETGDKGFQRKGRKGFDAKIAKFSDRIHRIDRIFRHGSHGLPLMRDYNHETPQEVSHSFERELARRADRCTKGLCGTVGRTLVARLTPLGTKPPLPAPHTLFLDASPHPSVPHAHSVPHVA